MMRLVIALAAAATAYASAPIGVATAADMAYKVRARVHHERGYARPVPRVYYQSVRPTAICRTVFLRHDGGWPKERGVARCVDFR